MQNKILVYKGDKYFIAEDPKTGVASQGRTKKESVKHLKEAVEGYLEVMKCR